MLLTFEIWKKTGICGGGANNQKMYRGRRQPVGYGEAQCSGFARAMKALCDAIGIDCIYVHADAKVANPSHQWNQVKVGGKWYILDAQGGLVSTGTWKKNGDVLECEGASGVQ